MFRTVLATLFLAILCWAEPKTETGELNGASFRIDVPEKWNGGLVMYCHGYNARPVKYENPKPNPFFNVFLDQGYALAQSGYAAGGWAIQEAVEDTEALRRYFGKKYGAPTETYVTGHSLGGFLTMVLMETFPNSYDAGLPLCGPLGAAMWVLERRPFDLRVVFDYYFPGALPSPVDIPPDFQMSPARNQEIEKLLDSKPQQAEVLRHYSGIRTNKELASTIVFFTYILKDLQQRGGGNPFDNRNIIYAGTPDDNALNDGVKRYASDPRATEYLRLYYTPTGRLTRPMLAIHTTYDPLVPSWMPNSYSILTEQVGTKNMFVQQYVRHDGHCAISNPEIARGFAQLRDWKTSGKQPPAGLNQ
jgi:pimeloyl-ACP methyl ester carboxylesterase